MFCYPGGGNPLGVPTVKDRAVQTAAKVVIEPIFEANLEPNTYGYRPKRSALDAIPMVHELLYKGYADVQSKRGSPQGGVMSLFICFVQKIEDAIIKV